MSENIRRSSRAKKPVQRYEPEETVLDDDDNDPMGVYYDSSTKNYMEEDAMSVDDPEEDPTLEGFIVDDDDVDDETAEEGELSEDELDDDDHDDDYTSTDEEDDISDVLDSDEDDDNDEGELSSGSEADAEPSIKVTPLFANPQSLNLQQMIQSLPVVLPHTPPLPPPPPPSEDHCDNDN